MALVDEKPRQNHCDKTASPPGLHDEVQRIEKAAQDNGTESEGFVFVESAQVWAI